MKPILRYILYGLRIDSQFDLGPPTSADLTESDAEADVLIRSGRVPNVRQKMTLTDEFVSVQDLASFHIRNGREIIIDACARYDPALLRIFLRGRLLAYLLRQRGWLPIHASAVAIGGGAVAFVAPSGTGKSTIAATFHAAGYPLLTDDVAPVRVVPGSCIMLCGAPRIRLNEDSASNLGLISGNAAPLYDKHDIEMSRGTIARQLSVRRIYLLEDSETLSLDPVPALLAATTLGRDCFIHLGRAGRDVLASHLKSCAEVAGLGLVRRLLRPRQLSRLNDVVALVLSDLAERTEGDRMGYENKRALKCSGEEPA